ncbi:MAG: succinyl-diaminopimelate desuccinylase [Gaiellaceae bacterium]
MNLDSVLAARTLALVDISSATGSEAEIARYVRDAMTLEPEWDDGDVLFFRTPGEPRVLLAGHLDTVPAQDNLPGRLEGGFVVGLGASDMKGGLAVMIELARAGVGAGYLFFTREEGPAEESPLPSFLEACRAAREAKLAIMLEPTDNTIQAGCLGNLVARLVLYGTSAHSARPWTGHNAIHEAIRALTPVASMEPVDVEVEGLVFREVLSVVAIEGGIADNVVPDHASCRLNFRYAPHRSAEQAEQRLRELLPGGELEVLSNSPGAPVAVELPLVRALREAGGFEVEPKQAWTPVAQFAAAGIDAVNLGPGATGYAHRRDERVEVRELTRTFDALRRFLGGSV